MRFQAAVLRRLGFLACSEAVRCCATYLCSIPWVGNAHAVNGGALRWLDVADGFRAYPLLPQAPRPRSDQYRSCPSPSARFACSTAGGITSPMPVHALSVAAISYAVFCLKKKQRERSHIHMS